MENDISVVNGVEMWKDESGVTHFRPVEDKTGKPIDNRGWFKRLIDWWTGAKVKPYVKIRDAADPFGDRTDPDAGSDGKTRIEGGVKISF